MFVLGYSSALDLVYVIDTSSGASSQCLVKIKEYIINDITGYEVSTKKVKISLVVFGETSEMILSLNEGNQQDVVVDVLQNLKAVGGKRRIDVMLELVASKVFSTSNGHRKNVKKLVVLFTTGKSDSEGLENLGNNSMRLKEMNVIIAVIGVGDGLSKNDIKDISSKDEFAIIVPFDNLPNLISYLSGILLSISGNFLSLPECL